MVGIDTTVTAGEAEHVRGWRDTWRAFARDRAALVSLIFLALVILAAAAAPWVAPHDPDAAVNSMRNAPPGSSGFLLGADSDGRDILSRLLWGGRISLLVGLLPCLLSLTASLILGTIAGYFGGWLDQLLMRLLDVVFAFPLVLLAIAIAGSLQPGILTEVVAITIVLIPYISRLVRSTTISVREMPFIEAARAGGARHGDILLRYILPNILVPVIAYVTTLIGIMIVIGSGLSFLGLGVQPPRADWGTMVSDGRTALSRAPHITIFPGALIGLVSLAFNYIGDGLSEILQPRRRSGA
jgi:ABC-type dipeptide/oligopeptide/nickel transport system permease subunit